MVSDAFVFGGLAIKLTAVGNWDLSVQIERVVWSLGDECTRRDVLSAVNAFFEPSKEFRRVNADRDTQGLSQLEQVDAIVYLLVALDHLNIYLLCQGTENQWHLLSDIFGDPRRVIGLSALGRECLCLWILSESLNLLVFALLRSRIACATPTSIWVNLAWLERLLWSAATAEGDLNFSKDSRGIGGFVSTGSPPRGLNLSNDSCSTEGFVSINSPLNSSPTGTERFLLKLNVKHKH